MMVDLAIVGAGPAGMAAAALAAKLGLDTLLIDEQEGPGGQIYRAIERADTTGLSPLGADYLAGQPLVAALRASGARYRPATTGVTLRVVRSAPFPLVLGLRRPWPRRSPPTSRRSAPPAST